MKAIVCNKYGTPDDLEILDIEKPVPGDDEILVHVRAASITYSNLILILGKPFIARLMGLGFLKPKCRILGSDIAGVVESVGKSTSFFKPGDEVYGDLSEYGRGGFAEYVCAPENALALKPSNADFIEASTLPEASLVALQALRDHGCIEAGQDVLIYGASGGIGTYAVQLAHYFGAKVTGVCGPDNQQLVRSLGADMVLDYTRQDFTAGDKRYDLIVSTAGYRPLRDYEKSLNPCGRYVCTGGKMKQIFQAMLLGQLRSKKHGKQLGSMLVKTNQGLDFIRDLYEAGKIRAVIDRTFELAETAEAFRYYAKGHTQGKLVLTI